MMFFDNDGCPIVKARKSRDEKGFVQIGLACLRRRVSGLGGALIQTRQRGRDGFHRF
jgi:hypothetical protein